MRSAAQLQPQSQTPPFAHEQLLEQPQPQGQGAGWVRGVEQVQTMVILLVGDGLVDRGRGLSPARDPTMHSPVEWRVKAPRGGLPHRSEAIQDPAEPASPQPTTPGGPEGAARPKARAGLGHHNGRNRSHARSGRRRHGCWASLRWSGSSEGRHGSSRRHHGEPGQLCGQERGAAQSLVLEPA